MQIRIDQHVHRVENSTFGRILDWDNSVIGCARLHLAEDIVNRLDRPVIEAHAKVRNGCLMRVGRFGPEISNH